MVQQVKPQIKRTHPFLNFQCESWMLHFEFISLLNVSGEQQFKAEALEAVSSLQGSWIKFLVPSFSLVQPHHCGHLGKWGGGKISLTLHLPLPVTFISNIKHVSTCVCV